MQKVDLIRAIGFAHQAERFRDGVFLVALTRNTRFSDLHLDFKVLAAYRIRVALLVLDPDGELERDIALSNAHGMRFQLLDTQPSDQGLQVDFDRVRQALDASETPVVRVDPLPGQTTAMHESEQLLSALALELNAQKVLMVAQSTQELEDRLSRARVTLDELDALTQRMQQQDVAHFAPRLHVVRRMLEGGVPEVAFVVGAEGRICDEVFSPGGGGILFSRADRTGIRRAELTDVTDIALYTGMEAEAGRLRPLTENDIADQIDSFWLYEVDDTIVSVSRLKRYGDWAELGAAITLTRDRGRGRGGALVQRLLREGIAQDLEAIFVLGKDPRMEKMFGPLGFTEVDRTELPAEWQADYDMSRPTRAFVKYLR